MKRVISLYSDDFYKKKAEEFYREARGYVEEKKYKEAAAAFQQASQFDAYNPEYSYFAGVYYYMVDEIEEALSCLKKALKISPEETEFQYTYAKILYRNNEISKASVIFQRIAEEEMNLQAMIHWARCLSKENKHEKAIDVLQNVLFMDPANHEALFELGCVYVGLHNYSKAEEIFKKNMKKNRYYLAPRYFLAKVYWKTRKHDEAIEILMKIKEEFPEETELADKYIKGIEMAKNI